MTAASSRDVMMDLLDGKATPEEYTAAVRAESRAPVYERTETGFWRSLWLVLRGWRIDTYRRIS